MAEGLLDKANIILTPTGYKAGTMYNVAPIEQPYEDFDFARASVASRVNSSGLVEMVGRTLGSNLVQNGDFSEIGPDLVQNGTFDLGSELVSGGNFETQEDVDLWTGYFNAVLTLSEERLLITPSAASSSRATRPITTVVGATYKLVVDFENPDTSTVLIGFTNNANGGGATFVTSTDANGTLILYYTATATTTYISLSRLVSDVKPIYYDNVSVKEVPDWILGTGWSIEDGKAVRVASSSTDLVQVSVFPNLTSIFKITFDVVRSAGSVRLRAGTFNLPYVGATDTYTYYVTPTSNDQLKFQADSSFVGSIDNVVVQELDPNDYWSLETGWSIGDDTCIVTNGPLYQRISQSLSLDLNSTYQVTIECSQFTNGYVYLRKPRGTQSDTDLRVNAVGTFKFTLQALTDIDEIALSIGAAGTNLTISSISVKEVIDTNNIPRINYDSNGENGHWLLEPTSTNLLPYSEDFTTWTVNAATTVYSNTTETLSPSGEYNASKITSDGSNGLYKAVAFGGGDNTKSIYLKGIVGGEQVILRDPAQTINQKTLTLTTDWVRYELSENQTSTIGLWINEIPSNGIYMWGGQLEALSYATSYIPTLTGSTETRATETANGAGSADLINSTEGVLYAEIAALADDGTNRSIAISDGSTTNRVNILYSSITNKIRAIVLVGGSTKFDKEYTVTSTLDYHKVALKYKTNDFALWIDGVERLTDTSGTIFAQDTLNELSFNVGSAILPFYGKCKELAVFGEALSDDELEKLTSWSSFNAMATDLGYTIE